MESVLRCDRCDKPFNKQSSLKRHGYYCRSRSDGGPTIRARSCLACAKAKVRCDNKATGCSRCAVKAIDCRYPDKGSGTVSTPRRTANRQKIASLPELETPPMFESELLAHSNNDPDLDQPLTTWELELMRRCEDFEWTAGGDETRGIRQFDDQVFEHPLSETTTVPSTKDMVSRNDLLTGSPTQCISMPSMAIQDPLHFTLRSFSEMPIVGTGAQRTIRLIRQILNSFPTMMLQQDALPPFIHSQSLLSDTERFKMEPLTNCMSLVQMISSGVPNSRKLFWKNVRLECDRICTEEASFDKWALLASMQALTIYILMRLAEGETEYNDVDISLLGTLTTVAAHLMIVIHQMEHTTCCWGNTRHSWKDWVFEESRRRLSVTLNIVKMLVSVEPARLCTPPQPNIILAPLPARKAMWEASDETRWSSELMSDARNESQFALASNGELVRLYGYTEFRGITKVGSTHGFNATTSAVGSNANWEEWCSGMDGFGALVMLTASLL